MIVSNDKKQRNIVAYEMSARQRYCSMSNKRGNGQTTNVKKYSNYRCGIITIGRLGIGLCRR